MDTTTVKQQFKIHPSTLISLTSAMEGDTKSDFTTTKKKADFSYVKNVPRRAKHQGWKWFFQKHTIYQKVIISV